jgi:hypothetical protein
MLFQHSYIAWLTLSVFIPSILFAKRTISIRNLKETDTDVIRFMKDRLSAEWKVPADEKVISMTLETESEYAVFNSFDCSLTAYPITLPLR